MFACSHAASALALAFDGLIRFLPDVQVDTINNLDQENSDYSVYFK